MKKIFGCLLVGSLEILVSACGAESAPAPDKQLVAVSGPESKACQNFIAGLPHEYLHDYISVRENPADPNSPQIRVFYYGRLVPGVTPVVFFNGGPAQDGHGDARLLRNQQLNYPELGSVPFVFIDQRGTGCSEPYPKVSADDALLRLAHYGSTGIVYDAEAIRRRLIGNSPWKVFGQSYGAYIVHRYVTLFPNSVVSAHGHGDALQTDPMQRLTSRIESQHRVVASYLAVYPDDEALLKVLKSKLTVDACYHSSKGTRTRCGKDLLNPIYTNLGFTESWLWVHGWLNFMVDGDGLNQAGMQDYVDKLIFGPASQSTGWASRVIRNVEGYMASMTKANCTEVVNRLKAKGEDPESWYLDECQPALEDPVDSASVNADNLITSMHLTPDVLTIDAFKRTLASHPNLNFYLYSGSKDPYVPVENFSEELGALGSLVKYTNFTGTGHDGFFSEPLVWRNLMR